MNDVRLTFNDLIVYAAIVNTILGALFGVFPLVVGLRNSNRKYAVIGFIGSIIGGFLLSVVLAFPVALIFTLLALRPTRQEVPSLPETTQPTEAA
jgi:hypothetical protein